ncbi:cytochrome P450 [Spongiibacter sp. KMU-166]|uniref:Cytochrome P450 n=1 Tax=Spongiibacter thalassae TaxID=2721624 RepID=A0ABX1GC79_9GAMM|nr:cytochrome P450 [Spongiibacter thalassae]NKI16546.1 cytochrome P450 [Spongiibacter thalassae]
MSDATPRAEYAAPDHVPANLIKSVDYNDDPALRVDPYRALAHLHDGPPIFWNPLNTRHGTPGTWDVPRASYMREILSDQDTFSSKNSAGFSALIGESWLMTPLEIDPPDHTFYRAFLNPLFSPIAVRKMDERIQARAQELIDGFKGRGECEFITEFARPFPIAIIMQLLGLPITELDIFIDWGQRLLHGSTMEIKAQAAAEIHDYLKRRIAEKRRNPQDDFISYICKTEVDSRRLDDGECMGICYLMFVGGLDTVASSLGFQFHHLATHPEHKKYLQDNPKKIPSAVDEYLRRFSSVMTARQVTRDIEFHGVAMKQGDWITLCQPTTSIDPLEYSNPMEVDFNRRQRHLAFSFGPHFCLGKHIAFRELNVALEKILFQMPELTLAPGSEVITHGGAVFGVAHLELQW